MLTRRQWINRAGMALGVGVVGLEKPMTTVKPSDGGAVDVRTWGAKESAGFDSGPAIQRCLDEVAGRAWIEFPRESHGIYSISEPLRTPSSSRLRGPVTIKALPSYSAPDGHGMITVYNNDEAYQMGRLYLDDVLVNGNDIAVGGILAHLQQPSQWTKARRESTSIHPRTCLYVASGRTGYQREDQRRGSGRGPWLRCRLVDDRTGAGIPPRRRGRHRSRSCEHRRCPPQRRRGRHRRPFRVRRCIDADRGESYDLVLILEALHDLAKPTDVLRDARSVLADNGVVVVADEKVAEHFTAPGDGLERMMYGWSVLHCLPASLAEEGSAAIGTVLRDSFARWQPTPDSAAWKSAISTPVSSTCTSCAADAYAHVAGLFAQKRAALTIRRPFRAKR